MSISLASLKAHLNITTDDDDALLAEKLAAATAWVASYTGSPSETGDSPAPVDEAIRQLSAHLYENREASLVGVTAQSLPFGFLDLLEPYRAWVF
jgi:uncharacterized phage protein (predicted DNA packaging)